MTAKRMVEYPLQGNLNRNGMKMKEPSLLHHIPMNCQDVKLISYLSREVPTNTHYFCCRISISARSWNIGTAHDINCRFQGDLDPVDSGWSRRMKAYASNRVVS
jgi:hypothetical protein